MLWRTHHKLFYKFHIVCPSQPPKIRCQTSVQIWRTLIFRHVEQFQNKYISRLKEFLLKTNLKQCRVYIYGKDSKINVIYWPSTEPSINRCTGVNKRKQEYIRQLYNQVPQTAWVSSSNSWSHLRDKMPAWESAWGLQRPTVEPRQKAKEVLLWSEELGVNM